MPTLGVIMCPKDSKSSIIAIKFSYHGHFLSVSFNNEYKLTDALNEAEEVDADNPMTQLTNVNLRGGETQEEKDNIKRDPSFIWIYIHKFSEFNSG